MLMNLVSKTLKMNDDTFAPELEVVIRFPMEPLQDGVAMDTDIYEKLGRELASLLQAKNT